MRSFAFDGHLNLGRFAAALMLIWALTGAAMTLDPILRRGLDPKLPAAPKPAVKPASFRFSPSRLPVPSAKSVQLRQIGSRAWFEVEDGKGQVLAFDAITGKRVAPFLSQAELRGTINAALVDGRWTAVDAELVTAFDDHYKSGELPIYRAALDGPGGVILYVSPRDGSWVKTTTRWSRFFRWLGMGVHTWNLRLLKDHADDARRWSLVLLVAAPLAALAIASYTLLYLRRRARRQAVVKTPIPEPKKVLASALALALVVTPMHDALAQIRVIQAGTRGGPVVPVAFQPEQVSPSAAVMPGVGAPTLVSGIPSMPLGQPRPMRTPVSIQASAPAGIQGPRVNVPLTSVLARPGLKATPAAARAAPAEPASDVRLADPIEHLNWAATKVQETSRPGASHEQAYGAIEAVFEAKPQASAMTETFPPLAAAPERFGLLRSGGSAGGGDSTPPPPASRPVAQGGGSGGGRSVWGLYVTHAVHMVTMSGIWRVAWPLFALDAIGKVSLSWVTSASGLVTMATGLLAGVLVDRLLPRRSMAATAVFRAWVGVGLAAAAAWAAPGTAFFLAAASLHSFATTALHIGQSSIAPWVAQGDSNRLQRINTVLKLVTAGMSAPAALLGGWLVATAGLPAAFLAYAAVTGVLAPLYVRLLPRVQPKAEECAEEDKGSLWDAAKLVAKNPILIGSLTAMALLALLTAPLQGTTLPIIAKDLLGGGAKLLGSLQSSFYVGQFAGILAFMALGKRIPPSVWVGLGALGLATSWLFVPALAGAAWAYVGVGLMAFLSQPASVVLKTLFQKEVVARRPELIGRAMGLNNLLYKLSETGGAALIAGVLLWTAGAPLPTVMALAAAYTVASGLIILTTFFLLRPKAPPSPQAPATSLAPETLSETGNPVPAPEPGPRTSRDEARDAAARLLAEAGARERFAEKGLVLWHILRARTRSGEQAHLTFSLEDERAPRGAIEKVLAVARPELTAWIASVLHLPVDSVGLHARPLEDCCGADCQSCLRSKDLASDYWTGKPAQRRDHPPGSKTGKKFFGLAPVLPLGAIDPLSWHVWLGPVAGLLILWMATTGSLTILTPLFKRWLDPKLPVQNQTVDPAAFTASPTEARRALPQDARVKAVHLRAAPSSSRKAWYEFELESGELIAVHGRTGKVLPAIRSEVYIQSEVRRWLAESRWSLTGRPVLLTARDEQYRKDDVQLPVYRVDLAGPGGYRIYLSARDGRVLEKFSRMTRVLRWVGIGMHTFGFGLLKKELDGPRRVAMVLLIAAPILLTALFAYWAHMQGW